MGVQVPGRRWAREPRVKETELGPLAYGTLITLLVGAAALLLAGCGDDQLGRRTSELDANPSPLNFGVVAVDRTVQKTITLRNKGSAPLQIGAIQAEGVLPSAFVIPPAPGQTIPVSGSVEFTIGFEPRDEAFYQGKIILHTNSREEPAIPIDIVGEGARPVVTCTEMLDFGRIVLNTDKRLFIHCVNAGRVDAEIRVAGVDGQDPLLFRVGEDLTDGTALVAVGESVDIDVRYSATFLGTATARALIEITGAAEPIRPVPLSGTGFASDLVATPNCIHFGAVNPGAVARRDVTVYNGGNRPVTFDPAKLTDTSGVFGIVGTTIDGAPGQLLTLNQNQQAVVTLAFAPSALGTYAGDLLLGSDDPINPRIQICLTGQGGGADMYVNPSEVNFGRIAPGMRARAFVTVRNGGTSHGGPLIISGVETDTPGTFTVFQPAVTSLQPGGDAAIIEIEFHPHDIGTFGGKLIIRSNDGDTPAYEVPMQGEAADLPPCTYQVQPQAIRFGSVQKGATATLAANLVNTGANECVFSSVTLAPGTHGAFSQPGGGIGVATVQPGESLTVPVQFDARATGDFSGAVGFYVSSPTAPQGSIPITARSMEGCLTANPGAVEFGEQRISCPAVTRTVRLTNTCAAALQVTGATLGAGSMSAGEIALVAPALPLNLQPGASTTITVRYDPVNEGHDAVPLLINSTVYELTVPLHGSGTSNDTRTDTFSQADRSAVDVLFVVDNSGSMMEEQQAIGEAFDEFINYAVSQGIDYHIGVTTTGITPSGGGWAACPGGVDGGEAGRLFPATNERPRYITQTTANAVNVFRSNVQVGVCHWWEEGLEAAYRAVSSPLMDSSDAPNTSLPNDGNLGFYRPDARLSIIIVTDEDDHSSKDTNFYTNFFRTLKGAENAEKVTVHGVLGNGCNTASGNGDRYNTVIAATGGTTESICTTDWGRSLVNLAQETFGYSLRFPLSGRPVGPVTVTVNGAPVNTGWTFDSAQNSVVFTESTAPAPGSRVDVTYTPACGT